MTGAASKSFATEPGDFTDYPRGATQGLPLGAAPPPGLYGSFASNATGLGGDNGRGNQNVGCSLHHCSRLPLSRGAALGAWVEIYSAPIIQQRLCRASIKPSLALNDQTPRVVLHVRKNGSSCHLAFRRSVRRNKEGSAAAKGREGHTHQRLPEPLSPHDAKVPTEL
jgi:hypothetical protein